MKMVCNKEYIAGWLDSSIHDFLHAMATEEASTRYALITCLDSNFDPASLRGRSPELRSIANKSLTIGAGLLVSTERLLEADARSQIFFGFDELWFFPNQDVEPKPIAPTIVGPGRIDRARFTKLAKWMSRNACSLALGGGEGMNFIVKAHGLVRSLLGHSIEQPVSSLAALEIAAAP